MTNPVHQIQTLYRTLNSTDRSKVRLFVQTYKGTDTPGQKLSPKVSDWLLSGIMSELERRGLHYVGGNPGRWAPNYARDSELVRNKLAAHLEDSFRRSPSYPECRALGRACARALANYRLPENPLGLKYMLQNVNKTFEAIDQSYPGYLQAGMLSCLIGAFPKGLRD